MGKVKLYSKICVQHLDNVGKQQLRGHTPQQPCYIIVGKMVAFRRLLGLISA